MSSSKLKQATQYIIQRSQQLKKSSKVKKDSQARSDAEKFRGQYFVINRENEAAKLYKYSGIRLNRKERKTLFNLHRRFLINRERKVRSRLDPDLYKFLSSKRKMFKEKPGDYVAIVTNFEYAKALKGKNKENITQITVDYVNKVRGTSLKKSELSPQSQIGHGERGLAASQFGISRARDEAVEMFDLSDAEVGMIDQIIFTQRVNYGLRTDVSHRMLLSSGGDFAKTYTFVLSSQHFEKNSRDAQLERAASQAALQEFSTGILEQESSTSLEKGLHQVIVGGLTPKQTPRKTRVTGVQGKKSVKENSKATVNSKRSQDRKIHATSSRGGSLPKAGAIKKPRTRKTAPSALNITKILGLLNQRLNKQVIQNMGDPRLNNRTGTFAGSVKAVDVVNTRQGFASIGYTYDKNPYQTFEVGYKQGDPDRDPRKLIDMSIRQIAVEMGMGRIYTRRV